MFRPVLLAVLMATALIASLALPALASDSGTLQQVRMRDNCDPNNFPPSLCPAGAKGDVGLTQLLTFIGANSAEVLKERNALGWRFQPDHTSVKPGATFQVTNQGGEVHTFTDVTADGFATGGCVTLLNTPLHLAPNSLCHGINETSPGFGALLGANGAVPQGATVNFPLTKTGTVLYQCLIHPWMRMSVTVE